MGARPHQPSLAAGRRISRCHRRRRVDRRPLAGKARVEFRSLGDRLRFSVPGSHEALTLMAWVRVDSLPNDYNSLLLPTRYGPGALHWTLERGGELRLTMRNTSHPGNGAHHWDGPVSGPAVSNMDFGRWLFLTTTYDAANGAVTHYRDGIEVGRASFKSICPPFWAVWNLATGVPTGPNLTTPG